MCARGKKKETVWLFCRNEITINKSKCLTTISIEMILGWTLTQVCRSIYYGFMAFCRLDFQNIYAFSFTVHHIKSSYFVGFFRSFRLHHFSIVNFKIENCSYASYFFFLSRWFAIVLFLKHVIHMFNQQMGKTSARVRAEIAFSFFLPFCMHNAKETKWPFGESHNNTYAVEFIE